MSQPIPIKDIAYILNCSERVVRSYLVTVEPQTILHTEDPEELIPHETIIKLRDKYEGTLIHQRIRRLLGETLTLEF